MLGKRLRALREDMDLTQKDLGKILNIGNVTLSQYEKGDRNPDYETLLKIAEYFNVSTDYLLGKTALKNYDDYHPTLNAKDERDIQKELEKMMTDLDSGQSGPSFYGGNMELSEYDREVLKGSLEQALRIIKLKNKETYTPHKYRKNTDGE